MKMTTVKKLLIHYIHKMVSANCKSSYKDNFKVYKHQQLFCLTTNCTLFELQLGIFFVNTNTVDAIIRPLRYHQLYSVHLCPQ